MTDTPIDDSLAAQMQLNRPIDSTGPQRLLLVGSVSLVGIVFASFHVPHAIADLSEGYGTLALLTGALVPLLLAVGITTGGYLLWRSELQAAELRRVIGWFTIGVVSTTAVSGTIIVYQLLEGSQLSHIGFVLLDYATVGGLGGLLAGWYDAQNQRRREQLRVFQKVVEHTGHCICLTDRDGTIEYVNPTFEDQTGYDRTEALGNTPAMLRSGEHDAHFYEELWQTILSGEVWKGELVNKRKDGTKYHIEQTIAPVTNDRDEITHFVAINSDITQLKEYETELERKNERLDEFASVVSHDLRNPLNVAQARVDMAKEERDSEHLHVARKSLARMERLIEDVLALARDGGEIGSVEPVSLQKVSEAAWSHVESTTATLSVETSEVIEGDESRIQQLLENLFRNALEHGGDDVVVRVGDCPDGFYVEDTGAGLSEEVQSHLFESGYTTSADGTGLGLAIVQRIVDAHDWTITATNGNDGGARFEITGVDFGAE